MNDTKKRIEGYQKQLPKLKERVVAIALLLVMSLAIVTTTTFAWVVLSRNPEVSGVSTSVASNGNLEIALVPPDGSLPGESKVGDSFAANGQSISSANLTWGNMINLSDPAYGLENLVLRPAKLNTAELLTNPLYGAEYGPDGRITKLNSNFAYTAWVLPNGDVPGYFGLTNQYGVRAISSTKMEAVGAAQTYQKLLDSAKEKNLSAGSAYIALGANSKYMQSLATMMGLYMTARMNPDEASLNNPDCDIADIQNLRDMYQAFLDAFDQEADAMAELLNLQMFLHYGENYSPLTGVDVFLMTEAQLKALGNQGGAVWTPVASKLTEFQKDYNIIVSDLAKLDELCASGTGLKWKDSGLNGIVNNLVDVGKCTIGADNTPISSIGASNAMGYLSGTQEARITNGILYRFEERVGSYIEVKNLSISAKVKRVGITVPATVKANIQTTASRDYNLFTQDRQASEGMFDGSFEGGDVVAQDTFGLAVDFWVRTNAEAHYLILEGNVLTEEYEERVTTKDADGNTVELFVLKRSAEVEDENGEMTTIEYDVDLYQIVEDGVTTWYDASNYSPFELQDGENPTPKIEVKEKVIGYEGENRVWNKDDPANQGLSINSTTQGSGSCYVYYADTPEDQARSLELLKSMKVAFVDSRGKLISSANMDTEHFYANNGKVIVPLALDSSSSMVAGTTSNGDTVHGITALEKNVATRITAIVYLDGTELTNDKVLAASDIQGQLNIQFGTWTDDLVNVENEELMNKELNVSASIDKNTFDYDTATDPMTTRVSVNVEGSEPNSVTAFFLRKISATQGSREAVMTFTKDDSGAWTADYTFEVPGVYILRSVSLDGVEYDLTERPEVTIKGFTVSSLTCTQAVNNHITVMTAAGSYPVDMSLKFATHDETKMPKTVQGRFLRNDDGSAVNITFTYDSTTQEWKGSATFLTSGEYTLQYLVLDGEYAELDTAQQQTATVFLGMRVEVYTTSPHSFKFVPSEMTDNMKALAMQIMVLDNAGNQMPGLSGVKLTYNMKGSSVKKMDADLTWNGSYYVGIMDAVTAGPGIWQFGNVTVNGNTITNATTSPSFTIQSPNPPEYHNHSTLAYQYKPDGGALMNVQLSYSSAATMQAYLIKDGATEGVWVDGVIGSEFDVDGVSVNHWNFEIPKDANGYQDGNWTLTQLRVWDVFDTAGKAYTEEDPMMIDFSGKEIKSKVVNRVNISFTGAQSQDFGKTNGAVTGAFMDSYVVSGLNVSISDFEGKPIEGISNVKLSFVHENNSTSYGGYKRADDIPLSAMEYTLNGSGTTFSLGEAITFQYAGTYKTKLSFVIGASNFSYQKSVLESVDTFPANTVVPTFTVSSIAPTVKITEAHYASKSGGASTFTDTTTTVYYKESTETSCGITYYNYTPADVTISLTGYGKASSAKLQFVTSNTDGKVHLYEESQKDDGTATNHYLWTSDGACKRYMGQWESKTGSDSKTPAGTLTGAALILTCNGTDYQVDIPDIVINNPS